MANFQEPAKINLCACPSPSLQETCDLYGKDLLTVFKGRCAYRIDKGLFYLCLAAERSNS